MPEFSPGRALIPVEQIQKQFSWGMTPQQLRASLGLREFGLKLHADGRDYPPHTDCADWVLGPNNDGYFFTFGGKGKFRDSFVYGAIAIYGIYYRENKNDTQNEFLSHREAKALMAAGEKNIFYEPKHIGLTSPNGKVISKWGKSKGTDPVVEHHEHVIPYMYGEVDYVTLSTSIKDISGNEHEVFIMPKYNYHGYGRFNLELILTDGKQKVGSLKGFLKGALGNRKSSFLVTETEKISRAADFPKLIENVVQFLEDTPPAITESISVSENLKIGK